MNNYPNDVRRYDHDPRSPFYDDFSDGLDEMTDTELSDEAWSLLGMSEDPEVSRKHRHEAERRLKAIQAEQVARVLERETANEVASELEDEQ